MSHDTSIDWGFHPDFVNPFYGMCMNCNAIRVSADEQLRFVLQFRKVLPRYTSNDIVAMLNDSNWRPSKVAAWIIAIRNETSFIPAIAIQMQQRPSHVEHLCLALAILGTDAAVAAMDAYLNVQLTNNDPWEESISPDWAIAALEVIGRANRFVEQGGLWDGFVRVRPEPMAKAWERRLSDARECLPKTIEFINTNFT